MPENVDKEFARIDLIGDISALRPQTRGEKVQDALGTFRAIMSSYDLSAFRQAALVIPSHPIMAVKKISGMTRSMFDEKFYVKAMYKIKQDPMYKVGQSGDIKLAITDMHSTITNEEAFRSTLAEKIPVIGRQIRGSNRAYVYLLNSMRQEIFNQLHKKAAKSGAIAERPELVSHLADFINHSTGRGSIEGLERSMNILGQAWFSPRLMMSRVKVFNHILSPNVDPFVRKEALKQLILFGGAVTSILGVAQLGGAEVETDPRSADFAKIKVGDTRFDIMGGYQQYAVLGTRLGLAGINRAFDQDIPEVLSSTTGRETTLGEGYKPATALTILGRFTETKENPIVSFVTDAIRGYDFQGEKFDPASEIGQRITSLTAQNLYELRNEEPWLFVAGAVASIFGIGVQTYGRSTQDILQTKKDFMISIGKGGDPERSNALMNVKDALRAGDQNAVDHYTKKYINAGGKKEDFIKSLHTMHPLHGMTQKEVNQFVSTLSPEEKQKLKEEKDRYYKEFSPDGK